MDKMQRFGCVGLERLIVLRAVSEHHWVRIPRAGNMIGKVREGGSRKRRNHAKIKYDEITEKYAGKVWHGIIVRNTNQSRASP